MHMDWFHVPIGALEMTSEYQADLDHVESVVAMVLDPSY